MTLTKNQQLALKDYRSDERAFVQTYGIIVAICVLLCVVSRAPTMIDKVGFQSISLILNVGHVVVFGPFVIVALLIWRTYVSRHLAEARQALAKKPTSPLWRWAGLFGALLPAIACLFLFRQFVFETTVPGVDCAVFDHMRVFWDWSLSGPSGSKLQYCFGTSVAQQDLMPHVYRKRCGGTTFPSCA